MEQMQCPNRVLVLVHKVVAIVVGGKKNMQNQLEERRRKINRI